MSTSDLFPFLSSSNPNAVELVLEHLMPYSNDSAEFTPEAVKRLAELSLSPNVYHASGALNLLVNLSASPDIRKQLMSLPNYTEMIIDGIIKNNETSDSRCMLLSNLVKLEECAIAIVGALQRLLLCYLQTQNDTRFHYLGSVFADVSVTAEGRAWLLCPDPDQDAETPLHSLSSYIEHPNIIRRGGVMTALKNCAFDVSKHRWMLSDARVGLYIDGKECMSQGLNILPRLMLRLITQELPEEDQENLPMECQFLDFTQHKPETDPQIQLLIVQLLVMLCTEPDNRQKLRDADVFVVVKELHLQLGSSPSELATSIHTLVNYLKRDDATD